jgi:hypothetical protein
MSPDSAALSLAPIARGHCHQTSRGYRDALRHMATETNGIAALDIVNTAMINPATSGSSTPNPVIMQMPLKSQTRASGVPISQNVRQSGISPLSDLARNVIDKV